MAVDAAAAAAAPAQAGSGTRARTGTPGISPARRCIPGPPSRTPLGSTRSGSRPGHFRVRKFNDNWVITSDRIFGCFYT